MSLQVARENSEKRVLERRQAQTFVRIRPLDEPNNNGVIALTMDFSDRSLTLLTYASIPVGTRILISRGDSNALGEVAGWEWDCVLDMTRLGVRLIDKYRDWSNILFE
jgi:hypothetical protein